MCGPVRCFRREGGALCGRHLSRDWALSEHSPSSRPPSLSVCLTHFLRFCCLSRSLFLSLSLSLSLSLRVCVRVCVFLSVDEPPPPPTHTTSVEAQACLGLGGFVGQFTPA